VANPFCRSPALTLTEKLASDGETPGDGTCGGVGRLRWMRRNGSAPQAVPRRDGASTRA
jgi:hypothetical protein